MDSKRGNTTRETRLYELLSDAGSRRWSINRSLHFEPEMLDCLAVLRGSWIGLDFCDEGVEWIYYFVTLLLLECSFSFFFFSILDKIVR